MTGRSGKVRETVSRCVFWLGLTAVGVLLIPVGLLAGGIWLVVQAMNRILEVLDGKKT